MISIDKARRLRKLIEQAAVSLSDEDALGGVELFPAWAAGASYEKGARLRYAGKLYRVEQAHTSQADWLPNQTNALYTEVARPGEIPVWRQPTGAQDAYHIGDRVRYPDAAGPVYESLIDDNTWAPDQYGWKEVL